MPVTATARGHRYRFAFGIQSAEGTPQVTNNALYESSFFDGGVEPVTTKVVYPLNDTDDSPPGYYTTDAWSQSDVTVLGEPFALPALYYLHLGGQAVSGAGPYVHTMTKSDAPVFGTFFHMRPDIVGGTDRWEQMSDGFVKGIELTAAAGEILRAKLDVIGKSHIFNITAPTPTGSPSAGLAGDYRLRSTTGQTGGLTAVGATFKRELDTTPASTVVHDVQSVVVNSSWSNFAFIQTDTLNPLYWDKGGYSCTVSATIVFQDFTSYAETFFGTKTVAANMTQSPTVVYGSMDFSYNTIAQTAARYMQIQLPSLDWVVQPPKLDVSGKAVTATLSANLVASAVPISVIFGNTRVATYTSGP